MTRFSINATMKLKSAFFKVVKVPTYTKPKTSFHNSSPSHLSRSFSTNIHTTESVVQKTAPADSNVAKSIGEQADKMKWVYGFGSLLVGANVFTVWQETGAIETGRRGKQQDGGEEPRLAPWELPQAQESNAWQKH
jgi:hypothetical protein